jgi:hypothetical protein
LPGPSKLLISAAGNNRVDAEQSSTYLPKPNNRGSGE